MTGEVFIKGIITMKVMQQLSNVYVQKCHPMIDVELRDLPTIEQPFDTFLHLCIEKIN